MITSSIAIGAAVIIAQGALAALAMLLAIRISKPGDVSYAGCFIAVGVMLSSSFPFPFSL